MDSALKFFRQWLHEPRAVASLVPSGRRLAANMAAAVGPGARTVVELGGGTGAMTRALLDRGISPEHLMVLERNPELHAHLRQRFPGVAVTLANAFDLVEVVRLAKGFRAGDVDAVQSSLGLLTMSRAEQRTVLSAAFAVLRPEGRFVQFTYAPHCPVPRELLAELRLDAHLHSWTPLNLPPAFVYVLERPEGAHEIQG